MLKGPDWSKICVSIQATVKVSFGGELEDPDPRPIALTSLFPRGGYVLTRTWDGRN